MRTYQILIDATADLPAQIASKFQVHTIPMDVDLGDETFLYAPGAGEINPKTFYDSMRQGKHASTTQINPASYHEHFEHFLKEGLDILYIGLSSALSSTVQSAYLAAEELKAAYPERKIFIIDSLCASVGEAFLICEAAKRQHKGMEIEELNSWIKDNLQEVCHWFTVDDLEYLRRSGRLSGFVAALGGTLNIKPVLHVDTEGRLMNQLKAHGRKKSISAMVKQMTETFLPERGNTVMIGHGDCIEDAEHMAGLIKASYPEVEIEIYDIGPVIGAHTGPGVLALFFWGNKR